MTLPGYRVRQKSLHLLVFLEAREFVPAYASSILYSINFGCLMINLISGVIKAVFRLKTLLMAVSFLSVSVIYIFIFSGTFCSVSFPDLSSQALSGCMRRMISIKRPIRTKARRVNPKRSRVNDIPRNFVSTIS